MPNEESVIYSEDFEAPIGSSFPEWAAMGYIYTGNGIQGSDMQPVTNIAAPNGERFLGEFGGPQIVSGRPFVGVADGVALTLDHLPPHASVTLGFDLPILRRRYRAVQIARDIYLKTHGLVRAAKQPA